MLYILFFALSAAKFTGTRPRAGAFRAVSMALAGALLLTGPAVAAEPHVQHTLPVGGDSHVEHVMPAENSAGSSSAAAQASGVQAPAARGFVVNGTVPSGMPITNNAGGQIPPPAMIERLGETVPPGIMLRDENGNRVDVRELMDIPTLVVPVFLSCPAACNTLQSSVAAALPQVNLEPGKDFRVLTVSFDEDDTPALAARKKENFLAAMDYKFPASEFRYLTGDKDSIKQLMNSLGFPFIRLGPGNFSHPVGLIVLAPGGKVARYLYGQGVMPFDVTMAVNEAAQGKVGLSIKRMLVYCFSYDPAARTYVFHFMRMAGVIILFAMGLLFYLLVRKNKKTEKRYWT